MHSVSRGSSVGRTIYRSSKSSYVCTNCSRRNFHQQRPLREGEDGNAAPARPATRRQGAQMAGRMIQGLRGMAPGGFGQKSTGNTTARTSAPTTSAPTPSAGVTRIIRQERNPPQKQRDNAQSPSASISRRRDDSATDNEQQSRSQAPPQHVPKRLVATLAEASDPAADVEAAQKANDLPLRRRLVRGRITRFANAEEKARVMSTFNAEKHTFVPVSKKARDAIGQKVVAGKYEALKGVKEGGSVQERTTAQLRTAMTLNGSYNPAARQAMLEFMGKMWPGQQKARAKLL